MINTFILWSCPLREKSHYWFILCKAGKRVWISFLHCIIKKICGRRCLGRLELAWLFQREKERKAKVYNPLRLLGAGSYLGLWTVCNRRTFNVYVEVLWDQAWYYTALWGLVTAVFRDYNLNLSAVVKWGWLLGFYVCWSLSFLFFSVYSTAMYSLSTHCLIF